MTSHLKSMVKAMNEWEKTTQERVKTLVKEVGVGRTLTCLISIISELGEEEYLALLRDDLQKALYNYEARYKGDETL